MLAAEQKGFWECFCASYATSDGFVLKDEKCNARHMSVECRSLITALNSPHGRVFNDASTFKTLLKLASIIENHFQLIAIPFHIIKAIFTNLCHPCHKCSTPVLHLWQGWHKLVRVFARPGHALFPTWFDSFWLENTFNNFLRQTQSICDSPVVGWYTTVVH